MPTNSRLGGEIPPATRANDTTMQGVGKPDPEDLPDGDGDQGQEGESGGENEHEPDDTK